MKAAGEVSNPYGDDKVIDSCSLFGMMNTKGEKFPSSDPVRAITNMHERANGLGGGFAVYGIYPEYDDLYALHIMYMDKGVRKDTEKYLDRSFRVLLGEEIPTREAEVWNPPLFWRYFVEPKVSEMQSRQESADDSIVDKVTKVNEKPKTFVLSSGKDMGVFKGVGFPEDIAEYFCLEEYQGYLWICHGRFPTNTPGWWGGAQPFSILDWSVAHNGELSSYGANRRYVETHGYGCAMQTDTEVLAYALDLLVRKHGIPIQFAAKVLAAPFWEEIDSMSRSERSVLTALRQVYGSLLMNGPFSIIVARQGEMVGLTDRIKLRPMTAAIEKDFVYLSSEEAAIRLVSPKPDRVWNPSGGEIVVGRLERPKILQVALAHHTLRDAA